MARRQGFAVVLVLVLVGQPFGIAAAEPLGQGRLSDTATIGTSAEETIDTPGPSAATDNRIVRTMRFGLTPSEPGEVRVRMAFSLPDNVVELTTGIPDGATVESTRGFIDDGTGNYSWDGETASPSVTFAMPANRTGAYQYDVRSASGADWEATNRPEHGSTGLTFVDTGPWALVSVPSAGASWSYRGSPAPEFVRRTETKGDGVAGDRMVYLGPHSATTRTIDGQSMTLVVPEAATLEASPDNIFASLTHASQSLQVGNKPASILLVAAPTTVEWGPYGLTDRSDAWVRADRDLSDPNNVWIHEYVHIRQDFRTTADARWTYEAMAEYYAALFTLETGRIGFEEFRDHLAKGAESRWDGTVLSEPDSWAPLANYVKGGLVFGTLDRQMRLHTDGSDPASHLVRAMNRHDGRVDHAFVRATVADLAGSEPASYLDRYATTDRRASMWDREAHSAAFSTLPPRIVTDLPGTYEISGPYRNRSVSAIPPLVPGETIAFPVDVANEGEATGDYDVALQIDGTAVASANGTLSGGANETVTLSHTFESVGNRSVALGDETWNAMVREPAAPAVTAVNGPEGPISPGESVPVTVTVRNPADRPASGDITVLVDGDPVASWTPRLDVGESAEEPFQLILDEPGEHTVSVDGQELLVTVAAPSTTASTTGTQTEPSPNTATTTKTSTPGLGIGLPVVVGIFTILIGRRWFR